MGIDAVAVLRIPKLKANTALGTPYHVAHRGDCSLHHTMLRYHATPPDELSLALRNTLGDALDAHRDGRGIYFFPDVCEPKSKSYEAIIAELGSAGVWAPIVPADHVPLRISQARPGTYDDLLRRALQTGGEATQAGVDLAYVYFLMTRDANARPDVVAEYRQELARVGKAMGEPFIAEMEKIFAARHAAEQAAEAQRQQAWAPYAERMARGEPLVTGADLKKAFDDGTAKAVLDSMGDGFKQQLQKDLTKMIRGLDVDVADLADDDVGGMLARTLGIEAAPKKKQKKPAAKKKKPAAKKRR